MIFDTIVAPATPLVPSALGIVRIDGPAARSIVESLARRSFDARHASHCRLWSEDELLDDAIVTLYVAPHSFTGNDLAEITLHGSPFLVTRLVQAAIGAGARMAEPGEFTERAVLNGKLDLLQAEAVLQLIESRTALQARLSLSQLGGALSAAIQEVRETLVFVIARLEAALDFADEGYEFIGRSNVVSRLDGVVASLRRLSATYSRGKAIVEGLNLVLLGRPNAGKSTLMNYLCGSERSIVTSTPGTTRDLLRETIDLGGVPVTITDTAGLRSSDDQIEEIGVARAREAGGQADLVVYLIDCSQGRTEDDDRELRRLADPLIVYTKADAGIPPADALAISVLEGRNVETLLEALDRAVRSRYESSASSLLVNERQKALVDDAIGALESAGETLGNNLTEEVVLVDLYRAVDSLASLTGAVTHREIMSEIFSKFCIGK